MPRPCLAVGSECRGSVPDDAPVDLCERHLAAAADWAEREYGVVDTMPGPCRLCGSRLGRRYPTGWLCAICEWRYGEYVDGELPPPRVDVVYYLRFDERVKIGTTGNPRQRFSAIWHDDLLALERGDRHLERRRHLQFAGDRFGSTEWFRLSPEILEHVELVRAGAGDPWEGYARWCSEALALRG